jgi:glycerol-3-phosphate acyltransferase PlsX
MSSVTIAVDAMGGDGGLPVTVPAVVNFLAQREDATVIMVGQTAPLTEALKKVNADKHPRLTIRDAAEVVSMDDTPSEAFRRKKNSSMRVAIDLIANKEADACVSAGNTGALMMTGTFVLKTLPGIDRPAIATQLPHTKGASTVLDLGANVNCSAEQLLQFAIMGSALSSVIDGIENPTVGLLNIGEEEMKGNDVVKEAAELLRDSGLNFYGNIEGDDIFKGTTNVVVCDGFVGNVTLKTIEGLVRMIAGFLKVEYNRNPLTKLAGLLSLPVLRAFKKRLDPGRYNGATLIGLRGIVIKSHGSADVSSFGFALDRAYTEVKHGMLARIAQHIKTVSETLPGQQKSPDNA